MYNVQKETLIYLRIAELEAANRALINAHRLPRRVSGGSDEGCNPLPNVIETSKSTRYFKSMSSKVLVCLLIIAKFVYMRDHN